jgi:hypothetical protein
VNKKIIFFRVFIIIFSIFVALGIVEMYLRTQKSKFSQITSVHGFAQFNINYGIEPKPKLKYDEYGVMVRTNSDATFGPEIKKNQPIILHLGDSYTAGPGIDYSKNYPHLLQEMINASSSAKYQTVILGMGGSSPLAQSFIFKEKLKYIKPKLTIYELYQNDLGDDYLFYYSSYIAKISTYKKFPKWLLNTRIGEKLYIFLSDQKAKANEKKYNETSVVIAKDPEYVWNLTMKPGLEEIKRIAQERGSPLVLFYIPLGWEFDNEYAVQKASKRDNWYIYAKKWAYKNKVPFIDIYSSFKKNNTKELNELYLGGDRGLHLTEKATAIVADELYTLLQKNQILIKSKNGK